MRKWIVLLLVFSLFVALPVFAQGDTTSSTPEADTSTDTMAEDEVMEESPSTLPSTTTQTTTEMEEDTVTGPTIATIASQNFVTLPLAINMAGLNDTLSGGEYTLFAPNDGAFITALNEMEISLNDLLNNQALLEGILTYHVIPGSVTSSELLNSPPAITTATVFGPALSFSVDPDTNRVVINNGEASVEAADVLATNGVVHFIDNVLLPPNWPELLTQPPVSDQADLPFSALDFVETNFVVFSDVIEAAGLSDELASGELTVFAPTDGAFQTLLNELEISREALLANQSLLQQVVEYHIIPGSVTSEDLRNNLTGLQMSEDAVPSFGYNDDISRVSIDNGRATVAQPDIYVNNGIVHIIDNVLIPPTVNPALVN
jgi:uncharacterized surface protein with fasciclin (FAS1) repeats